MIGSKCVRDSDVIIVTVLDACSVRRIAVALAVTERVGAAACRERDAVCCETVAVRETGVLDTEPRFAGVPVTELLLDTSAGGRKTVIEWDADDDDRSAGRGVAETVKLGTGGFDAVRVAEVLERGDLDTGTWAELLRVASAVVVSGNVVERHVAVNDPLPPEAVPVAVPVGAGVTVHDTVAVGGGEIVALAVDVRVAALEPLAVAVSVPAPDTDAVLDAVRVAAGDALAEAETLADTDALAVGGDPVGLTESVLVVDQDGPDRDSEGDAVIVCTDGDTVGLHVVVLLGGTTASTVRTSAAIRHAYTCACITRSHPAYRSFLRSSLIDDACGATTTGTSSSQ